MEEIWKDVKGFEGLYQVSNLGRVKSLDRITTRKPYGTRKKVKGGIMTKRMTGKYLRNSFRKGKKSYSKYVHRMVAGAFVENPMELPCVTHIDGDRTNNVYTNLIRCQRGNGRTQ